MAPRETRARFDISMVLDRAYPIFTKQSTAALIVAWRVVALFSAWRPGSRLDRRLAATSGSSYIRCIKQSALMVIQLIRNPNSLERRFQTPEKR